ncbi:MAG TPA: aminopeptidase P N-terminal domain-containing protein [Vicinamibacteria bacterium]|nr:aminopeptidase P N-terminal domain-containing protein [Vicinamibacteria bacterium]
MTQVYRRRRQKILNRLGDGLLVLPTAPLRLRNGDVYHAYRPDSTFYYLTGFGEPEAVLVARRIDGRDHRATLFLRPRDPSREAWDGPRLGPRRAVARLGVDEAHPIEALYERLEEMLLEEERLFYTLGSDETMDRSLFRVFERNAVARFRGNPAAHPAIEDPRPVIAVERLLKDAQEIALLQRAAEIAAAGHRRAMRAARPGMMEYELQAEIEAEFRRRGSPRNGYESIIASGANACTLHYVSNDRRMRAGDLVLVDAGAEANLYTADITRTFPVSGRFSDGQAAVYRIVLRAQKAAIRAVRPGRPWDAPHRAAINEIVRGLVGLGVLRGNRKSLIEKQRYRRWFMHGTSHWLGMDVHDVGGYQDVNGKPRVLKPGMVLTIEPGLYFAARDRSVPRAYRGIGVRIEDDVLVTRTGSRVLTKDAPKEIAEIEALCQS